MKKFLPTSTSLSVNSSKGFTLIELLVVVSILAVLAIIAFAAFTGLTGRGNNVRRSSDLKSFADAMEVKRGTGTVYVTVVATDFATGVFPKEPTTRTEKYCYEDGTSVISNPATSAWAGPPIAPIVACPTGWESVDGTAPTVAGTATYFKFCTLNEAKDTVICQGSRQ